jgi:RHS repeat-associated protein
MSQMKTAAGLTYLYDGDGRRAAKVGSTLHWYGSGGEVLAETDTSGNTQNEYIFFGGKRVAIVPASGGAMYYAEVMLGSSRVMVQSSGTLCYDSDFTPYGAERDYTSTCPQNYKFEGKERDPETLNDDFGARKYTWRFGRWLSSDWSAVPAAVPYANLTNPQTLNLYAMVADDPESFADLDGHGTADSQGAIIQDGTVQVNGVKTNATVAEDKAQNNCCFWDIPALEGIPKEIGNTVAGLFNLGNDIASSLSSAGGPHLRSK